MPLYRLRRSDTNTLYDAMEGFIIRAPTEKEARELASTRHGDEGKSVWLLAMMSTCEELELDGPSEILLEDFLAG